MLNLFNGMPTPQIGPFGIGARKSFFILQDLLCEESGIMFQRHGDGEVDNRGAIFGRFERFLDHLLQRADVIARLRDLAVKRDMFAAMHHFLLDKSADFALQLRRHTVAMRFHGFHKIGFATWEGDG